MPRLLLLTVLAWTLMGGAASAALSEAPFAPSGGAAACLRSTGQPRELALVGSEGPQGATDLWTASRTGATRSQRIAIPFQAGCAEVASAPNGAAVLAVMAQRGPRDIRRKVLVST